MPGAPTILHTWSNYGYADTKESVHRAVYRPTFMPPDSKGGLLISHPFLRTSPPPISQMATLFISSLA